MVGYLIEANQMIQQLLSEADFEEAFPHIFGHPKDHAEVHVRNECGLLLRKAQFHMIAVLRANKSSNLHSMAIHMRVVLECAAQVVSTAYGLCGNIKGTQTILLNYDLHLGV